MTCINERFDWQGNPNCPHNSIARFGFEVGRQAMDGQEGPSTSNLPRIPPSPFPNTDDPT
jgi:hypothetical protein